MRTKLSTSRYVWLLLLCSACGDSGDGTTHPSDAGSDGKVPETGDRDAGEVHTHDSGTGSELPRGTDCTQATGQCISAVGRRNGVVFECLSRSPIEDVVRFSIPPPRWSVLCKDGVEGFTLGVQFPVQEPGPISHSLNVPAEDDAFNFFVRGDLGSDGPSMTQASSNLVSGTLSGNLGADGVATGTLEATWGEPEASCESGVSDHPCAEGVLKLTFRLMLP